VARVAHGVIPLAALVSFELAMRVVVPEAEHQVVTAPAAEPELAVAEHVAEVRAERKRVSLSELVPVAEHVAAELVIRGPELTWKELQKGIRAAGYGCGDASYSQGAMYGNVADRAKQLLTLVPTAYVAV
jgi:hypothetical protein